MNLRNVYMLFEAAVSHRLKFPKIRLQTVSGQVVIIKLAGNQSRYQGQIQVTDDRPFGSNSYFGRIDQSGALQPGRDYRPEIGVLLERLAANPAEVAAEYGKLTGNCSFCQSPLTDPQSTAVGYGPICADHYGLPHGMKSRRSQPSEEPVETQNHAEAIATVTPDVLLEDPATPYWAQDLIRVLADKDPVDVLNTLEVLTQAFKNNLEVTR